MDGSRHERAVEALRRHDENGVPFVLLLRAYRAVAPIPRCAYTPAPFSLQGFVARYAPHGLGVLSIKGWDSPAESGVEWGSYCPTLDVPDDEWQAMAGRLIRDAALILCEFNLESAGVTWEIDTCRDARPHETVLIIPTPDDEHQFQTLVHFAGFNRFVLRGELQSTSIFDHPASGDLFEAAGIKAAGDDALSRFDAATLEFHRQRPDYVNVIPRLAGLAERYANQGEWRIAIMHAQAALNIGTYFEMRDDPTTMAEDDGLVRAALVSAAGFAARGYLVDAGKRLDLAEELCQIPGCRGHIGTVVAMRQRLREVARNRLR